MEPVGTPRASAFMIRNGRIVTYRHRWREVLRPFMLRRVKANVLGQLPEKVEKVLRCELSAWQKELYRQVRGSLALRTAWATASPASRSRLARFAIASRPRFAIRVARFAAAALFHRPECAGLASRRWFRFNRSRVVRLLLLSFILPLSRHSVSSRPCGGRRHRTRDSGPRRRLFL